MTLGPWTRAPTTFSNLFFQRLLDTRWSEKVWNGPKQYKDPKDEIMMVGVFFLFGTLTDARCAAAK